MKRILVVAVVAVLLSACGANGSGATQSSSNWKPRGDVTMVVPFGAGGGSDLSGRAMAAALEEAMPGVDVNVENREGGSGAVGYAFLQSKRGNANFLFATESALVALPESGDVKWSYEDFTPIMKIAEDFALLVAKTDAPYSTCAEVVEAAKTGRVMAGISGAQGVDNIVLSLTEKAKGVKFQRVPFESGGELVAALLGGQIQIAPLNPGEVMGQLRSKHLKALCVFAPSRYTYPELKDVATAKEQGLDVSYAQFRGLLAPGDITPAAKSYWEDAAKKLVETEPYKKYIAEGFLQSRTASGAEFVSYLESAKSDYQKAMG